MNSKVTIIDRIASVTSDEDFAALASEAFEFQLKNNVPYGRFVQDVYRAEHLDLNTPPFLPIELFKHLRLSCSPHQEASFMSSGTSGIERSTHHVHDLSLYDALSTSHFEGLYGPLNEQVVLALLPSYIENGDSSLVYMVDRFIAKADPRSCFLLGQPEQLTETLLALKQEKKATVLFGVSYALLDTAEQVVVDFPELIVMETGGMKGRREEMTRSELHRAIKKGFPSSQIHSEYGMTELLSQGYMRDGHSFTPPLWMRAYTTEISDPLRILEPGKRGLLAFIDLANYHSCSFIQTQDIGIVKEDGTFSVEGRLDHSDLRGCNLLYT